MKTLSKIALVAASALTLSAGAASAQGWGHWGDWNDHRSIVDRQAALDGRIDAGVRSGRLTRQEAFRLRAEFRDIARRADAYRVNGVTRAERADLDRRFDRLSQRIRVQAHDGDRYGYGYGDERWRH